MKLTNKDRTIYFLRRHIRKIVDLIDQHQLAKAKQVSPQVYMTHDNAIGELKEELELVKELIRNLEGTET
jgi:hypothetical protein